MRRSTDRQLRRSLSPAIISLGPCRRIRESFVLQHRATSPLIHQHHGRTSCVVFVMWFSGRESGIEPMPQGTPSCPHGRPPNKPPECKSVSRPHGPEPALWGGEVHDAWPSAGISPPAFSTPSPFERKPSSSGTGSRFGGVCRCGRPQCLRVRLMATFSLTIPGLIRGIVFAMSGLCGRHMCCRHDEG